MNADGKAVDLIRADDLIRKVLAVGRLGVRVDSPVGIVSGLAEITDGRLTDLERETITRISGIKGYRRPGK
jgi:hypothetical protein